MLETPTRTESAGGVVLNARGEVAIVNQRRMSWSLPKGHVEHGETPRQTAEREIAEEAGIRHLAYVRDLGVYERFRGGRNGEVEDRRELKRIHMFLFTTQDDLAPTHPDHPEARWVSPQDVAALLTHPKDKEFFNRTYAIGALRCQKS